MNSTGIIILAAGGSTRLGRPKQLLSFGKKLLVQHVTHEAINAKPGVVVVVTGANAKKVSESIANEEIVLAYNKNWQEGMGSSIKTGIAFLQSLPRTFQSVIICVCDQPFVNTDLFLELIKKKKETGKGMIACAYDNTLGTPVLFDSIYFNQLQMLAVTEGAKTLLQKYEEDVATVSFPLGQIDIDTEEEYKNLISLPQ